MDFQPVPERVIIDAEEWRRWTRGRKNMACLMPVSVFGRMPTRCGTRCKLRGGRGGGGGRSCEEGGLRAFQIMG